MEAGTRAPSPTLGDGARHLPRWFTGFDGLAWAVDAAGCVLYVNAAVEKTLDAPAGHLIGVPCETLFRLRQHGGEPFCRHRCLREDPKRRCLLPASLFGESAVGEIRLCIIEHLVDGASPVYLHLAQPCEVEPAIEYVEALAHRSADEPLRPEELTPAELRVMGGLCRDQTAAQIADESHSSVVTIRNHIQHILRKLGAHSIPEAVARYLLRQD